MIDLTIVVGLDAKTIEQFKVSYPTWKKNRPELMGCPIVIFYDPVIREYLGQLVSNSHECIEVVPWPNQAVSYESQREKMLSGFVHVPADFVSTPWWMKIDTDTLAHPSDDWIRDEWFEPLACSACGSIIRGGRQDLIALAGPCEVCVNDTRVGKTPVYVASPWGYTKPADQMAFLDNWGDTVDGLRGFPRLDYVFDPEARTCRHPRMASWVSYYSTEWTKEAARLASDSCGPCKLPVPSQDGYHFYVAERTHQPYRRVKMKRHGWNNYPRFSKLQAAAAEIMGDEGSITI